jgi:hypothetical protein
MKKYFASLKWMSYSTITMPFLELDKFADHEFDNGISIRISTGKMCRANRDFPYEMHIKYPNGNTESKTHLNKKKVIRVMAELDRYGRS